MSNRAVEKLDILISRLEAKLEHVKTVRSLFEKDPSLATDLLDNLIDPDLNGVLSAERLLNAKERRQISDSMPKVEEFFQANGNDWRTARQIAEGCDLPAKNVNYLLYTSSEKEFFDNKRVGLRGRVWRLKGVPAGQPQEPTTPSLPE
jgi:hypothetical protein